MPVHALFELLDLFHHLLGVQRAVFGHPLRHPARRPAAAPPSDHRSLHDVRHVLLNAARFNAPLPVEFKLLAAPAVGFLQRRTDRTGAPVRVQDGHSVEIARGPSDGLDQRAFGTQKPFLVGIEDRHQRNLGHVQTFAQEVDAHQHVEHAQAQIANDLDPFHRVDVRVQVANPDAVLLEELGQVFSHALGQRRNQDPFLALHAQADLRQHIVNLAGSGTHVHARIDQAGGTHDLLHQRVRVLVLERPRGGRDIDGLR